MSEEACVKSDYVVCTNPFQGDRSIKHTRYVRDFYKIIRHRTAGIAKRSVTGTVNNWINRTFWNIIRQCPELTSLWSSGVVSRVMLSVTQREKSIVKSKFSFINQALKQKYSDFHKNWDFRSTEIQLPFPLWKWNYNRAFIFLSNSHFNERRKKKKNCNCFFITQLFILQYEVLLCASKKIDNNVTG